MSNPPGQNGGVIMKNLLKNTYRPASRQMELGLPPVIKFRNTSRRQRRLPGAHWWFQQMRQAALRSTRGDAMCDIPAQGVLGSASCPAAVEHC